MSRREAALYWGRLGILAGLSMLVYLGLSASLVQPGFPLDDAWIHQGYARNLALHGEWSFLAGEPSAGSTSPLWAIVLAPAYFFQIQPVFWTHLMGWITLTILGAFGGSMISTLVSKGSRWKIWVAGGLLFEWHLVWAAASGMETLLAGVLFTLVFILLFRKPVPWLWSGFMIGLTAWVRPDGITLLGPAALVLLMYQSDRGKAAVSLALGFALPFGLYLAFNYLLAGTVWPNTFYAKQAEYEILRSMPIWRRYLSQASLPLVGVGVLLLPGFIFFAWTAWTEKHWPRLSGVLWWLGYLGIYAWRLPVTYQHGRYLMPAMPVYFIWGVAGLVLLIRRLKAAPNVRWLIQRVTVLSAVLVLLGFWALGAGAYARDVGFIESEMVAVAEWIDNTTPRDAVLAVHDIGAIGYFAGRTLVDLAGLVSPEVIPFIRDEQQLAVFLDEKAVDYLITFPSWYPVLVQKGELVYQTKGTFGPDSGGENMAVYTWP